MKFMNQNHTFSSSSKIPMHHIENISYSECSSGDPSTINHRHSTSSIYFPTGLSIFPTHRSLRMSVLQHFSLRRYASAERLFSVDSGNTREMSRQGWAWRLWFSSHDSTLYLEIDRSPVVFTDVRNHRAAEGQSDTVETSPAHPLI